VIVRLFRRLGTVILIVAAIAVVVAFGAHDEKTSPLGGADQALPAKPHGYLGVYLPSMPSSSAGLAAFGSRTGTQPNVAVYYSGWMEPFQTRFAGELAARGVVPLVQIDPAGITLSAITHGRYNNYLASYAQAVRGFGHPVIISFGHEMNGGWYSWGSGRTSAADFVAAWQHIVKVFRSWGADNVTWLWTVNSLAGGPGQAAAPAAWWPGADYVSWVGIDGYYYYPGETFTALFGTTVSAVRRFTRDPVLITETGVAPAADQAATIPRLFAGARSGGLLGVVYFDAHGYRDWSLSGRTTALASFGKSARGFG
jgi:mannan endo-1,4-beta-mannosidase